MGFGLENRNWGGWEQREERVSGKAEQRQGRSREAGKKREGPGGKVRDRQGWRGQEQPLVDDWPIDIQIKRLGR